MEKMQILFPEPQLHRLRSMARRQDRPVSELVRAAVDTWLAMHEFDPEVAPEGPPVYSCGELLTPASSLRDAAYEDSALP
ncbi:MAG: ribbon-helix-helix protein, CopG family [Spirochaetaceae bacterium]|nr:MAG: ribbon-helix-helix protein, CopG family [Spirochaetaceae bacterium]